MRISILFAKVSMIYITNECFLGGHSATNNNTHKHKQNKE